jgi:hypothetical protein
MKLTLDTDNIDEALVYLKAPHLKSQVGEFRSYLRNKIKHGDYSQDVEQILEEIWKQFHEIVEVE